MMGLDNQPLRLVCSLAIVLLHGAVYALGGLCWLLGIWVATVIVWCLWNVIEVMS